uniref:Uncharacterized protein n=1 Tax=Timema bartmani TaxID=61472 RepID=A0A7R9ER85_9NEOP|nr:unnamed protein product [Timema bartmani]
MRLMDDLKKESPAFSMNVRRGPIYIINDPPANQENRTGYNKWWYRYRGVPADPEALQGPFGRSFEDKTIRSRFVKRVYLILLTQLLFTLGIIALFMFQKDVRRFVLENRVIIYSAYGVFFVTYVMLICCTGVRRRFPFNFILLAIFTMAMSYMTAAISTTYNTYIVFIAMGITAVVCLGVTLFSIQTKWDITGMGAYLCIFSLVVMVFGIVAIFISMYTRSSIMMTIYAEKLANEGHPSRAGEIRLTPPAVPFVKLHSREIIFNPEKTKHLPEINNSLETLKPSCYSEC